MQNSLNTRQDSVKPISEFLKGPETTLIGGHVEEIRKTVARLKLELKLSKAILESDNFTSGSNTDGHVEKVGVRVIQVRKALGEICRLDIRDPEFEANFRRIKDGVLKE